MTVSEAIFFAARVKVGDILVSCKQEIRFESITPNAFKGKAIFQEIKDNK